MVMPKFSQETFMSQSQRIVFAPVSRLASLGGALCICVTLTSQAMAQSAEHGHGGGHGMHAHGADGTGHDMVTMPGLRGDNVTEQESLEMEVMFRNFPAITRSVENLPNGIRTVTGSDDPEIMDIVISHVVGMIDRVEMGEDPKVFIQSPTLDIFFERRAALVTEIDVTDEGVVVIQTSDDPELVAAMHAHAAEVTAMVDRGMDAVHEMMMERAAQ